MSKRDELIIHPHNPPLSPFRCTIWEQSSRMVGSSVKDTLSSTSVVLQQIKPQPQLCYDHVFILIRAMLLIYPAHISCLCALTKMEQTSNSGSEIGNKGRIHATARRKALLCPLCSQLSQPTFNILASISTHPMLVSKPLHSQEQLCVPPDHKPLRTKVDRSQLIRWYRDLRTCYELLFPPGNTQETACWLTCPPVAVRMGSGTSGVKQM